MNIETFTNRVFLDNWENIVPNIPSSSIDLILTSPPYNVKLGDNKLNKNKYKSYDDNMDYDDYLGWMRSLFDESFRVLKKGGRIAINIGDGENGAITTHSDFTYMLKNEFDFVPITTIVWDKNQIGSSTAWGSFKSPRCPSFPTQFEFVIVMGKETKYHEGDPSKISISKENFIRNSRALWRITPETQMMSKYDHPAMFPIELPLRLIDHLTYIDDIVMDTFSGIATTCCAAKMLNRKYIGIEKDQHYFNGGNERLGLIPELNQNGLPSWL
jgi:DNA modification methylase